MVVSPIDSKLNRIADIIVCNGPVVDCWPQTSCEEIIVMGVWKQAH